LPLKGSKRSSKPVKNTSKTPLKQSSKTVKSLKRLKYAFKNGPKKQLPKEGSKYGLKGSKKNGKIQL
jgi:hypothetical protein